MWRNTEMDRMVPFCSLSLENSCSDVRGALECISRRRRKMWVSGHPPRQWVPAKACGGLQVSGTWHEVFLEPATGRAMRRLPSIESQEEQKRTGHCVLFQTPLSKISQHGETTSRLKRKKQNLGRRVDSCKQTALFKGLLHKAAPVTQMLWAPFCLHTSHHPCIKLHPITPNS